MSDHDGEECGCCAEWSEEEVREQRARMRGQFVNVDTLKDYYTPERLRSLRSILAGDE